MHGFLPYFYKEHIEKNNYEFDGEAISLTSSNYCLESFKSEGT